MAPAFGPQVPFRTQEQLDERLIDQAYGNIAIEHPDVTREQVAEVLKQRRRAEVVSNNVARH